MTYKFDIKKQEQTAEIPTVDPKRNSKLVAPEVLAAMGVKPSFKPSQEDLDKSAELTAGAYQLMHKRVSGQTEFRITNRQFDQFKIDVVTFSKLVISGYKTYTEFYNWIEDQINMPDELGNLGSK